MITPRYQLVRVPELWQIVDTSDGEILATLTSRDAASMTCAHLNRGSIPAESVAPNGRWTDTISEAVENVKDNLRALDPSGSPSRPTSESGARNFNINQKEQ
jgi:hypothetical protein